MRSRRGWRGAPAGRRRGSIARAALGCCVMAWATPALAGEAREAAVPGAPACSTGAAPSTALAPDTVADASASPARPAKAADTPASTSPSDSAAAPAGPTKPPPASYETLVITRERPSVLEGAPVSRTVLDAAQDGLRSFTGATDALALAPGVLVQNRHNFAQDMRLSIRGFGDRATFGVRGIRVLLDGIPLTLPDGQTVLDGVDFGELGRIEVVRGPATVLWGNGSGAALLLSSREVGGEPRVDAQAEVGAFGTSATRVSTRGALGRAWYDVSADRFATTGYRARSASLRGTVAARVGVHLGESTRLVATTMFFSMPRAEDPGGLTAEERDADPRVASGTSRRWSLGEAATQLRAGVLLSHGGDDHQLDGTLYAVTRTLDNAVPARWIGLTRQAGGGSLRYRFAYDALGMSHQTTAGASLDLQDDGRQNFTNQDGNPVEPLLLNQDEKVTAAGVFVHHLASPGHGITLMAGGRYDDLTFRVRDLMPANGDQSGSRRFRVGSGHAGASHAPWRALGAYVDVGQVFETPTTNELTTRPDGAGGLSPDLQPQRATSYEVGLRGSTAAAGVLEYGVAAFRIRLRDELVRREDASGRAYYVNAARSHRDGVELALSYTPGSRLAALRARASYTLLAATFDRYERGGVDLAGNRVPGVPVHRAAVGASWVPAEGPRAGVDLLYVSPAYADDANTMRGPAALVLQLRGGWAQRVGDVLVEAFVGVENALDRRYSDNVRVNATAGRYFEPAPPRTAYAGVALGWALSP